MVTQNKCNVNVGELIEFLSRRHGQGKFITDEYAVVLEAALKAAVARKAKRDWESHGMYGGKTYMKVTCEAEKAEMEFDKVVDAKEAERGR